MSRLSLLILTLMIAMSAYAQDMATITGAVADEYGKPLELVNVVVKENQKYFTATDSLGRYTLRVPAGKRITIVFLSLIHI